MPSNPPDGFDRDAGISSTRSLAEAYGQTQATIRRWRHMLGIPAPDPAVRQFVQKTLFLHRFILTSDWHVPYHDPRMVRAVLAAAARYRIDDVVALGDVIDFPTLSRFEPRDIDSTVGMELSTAGDVLDQFIHAGLRIHWSRGNHELRFFRAMKHQVTMDDLIRIVVGDTDQVVGYEGEELEIMHVGPPYSRWLLSHPDSYSTSPLSIPRAIQQREHCNVACGHSHMYAMGFAPDGYSRLLETGGLFDPSRLAYLHRGGMKKFPNQQRGFWVMEGNSIRMWEE